MITTHKKIIQSKGGHVLENRTKVGDVHVGDEFVVSGLKDTKRVLFFFKDRIFKHRPMVFGLNEQTGGYLMISTKLITITSKRQEKVIRKRRK